MSEENQASVFQSRSHARAIAAINAALEGGAVCVAVTGPSGAGKTTLCRELTASGDARTFTIAIMDAKLHAGEVLSLLLREFGLTEHTPRDVANDRAKLAAAAERFLVSLKPLGAHAVVVVDDADRCDIDVLEMLLRLASVGQPQVALLRLVLVGQPSLDDRLNDPRLARLRSLASTRVPLEPLDASELSPYIAQGMQMPPEDMSPAQIDEIFSESEDIPARLKFQAARPDQSGSDVRGMLTDIPTADAAIGSSASKTIFALPWPAIAALVIAAGLVAVWAMRSGEPPRSDSPSPAAPAAQTTAPAAMPADSAGTSAPPAAAPASTPPQTPGNAYRIAVAAFRTSGRAEQIASQLRDEHITVAVRTSGEWYQVLAGPYATLEEARSTQAQLARLGLAGTQVAIPPPVNPDSSPDTGR